METVFLKLLNISITAGWLVLAVLVCRLLFKKAPRVMWCLMWGLVALRLILPFSIESVVSLIPSVQTVPEQILYAPTPAIDSGIPAVDSAVNGTIGQALTPNPRDSVNPVQVLTHIAALVWLIGMAVMLVCAAISYRRVKRQVGEAVPLRDKLWQCDRIASPFILGLIRPRVYLPSDLKEEDAVFVIAHERAHLRRRDHWWKPLGFLLLTVYWFHPLMWVGYWLLCRDIEYACDEKVLKKEGTDFKKGYSTALINCSVTRRSLAVCPLAFGEVGVKNRVKQVLNYKKPAFWVVLAAVIVSAAVAVCFITNPVQPAGEREDLKAAANADEYGLAMKATLVSPTAVTLTVYQHKTDHHLDHGTEYAVEELKNDKWKPLPYLLPSDQIVWSAIAYVIPDDTFYNITLHVQNLYGPLQPGTYRIKKEFSEIGKGTQGVKKTYYAEFTVGWDDAAITGDKFPYSNTEPVSNLKTASSDWFYNTSWIASRGSWRNPDYPDYQDLTDEGLPCQLRYTDGRFYSVSPLADGSYVFILYSCFSPAVTPVQDVKLYVSDIIRIKKLADSGSADLLREGMPQQEVLEQIPSAFFEEGDGISAHYLNNGDVLNVYYMTGEEGNLVVKSWRVSHVLDTQVMYYLLPIDRKLIS